jgi:uncharacterized membrane protein YgcG
VLGSALPRATADTLLLSSCSCQLTPSVAAPAGASSPLLLLLLLLQVPADQVATTPVQLYATAGLRALPNDTSARLLAAVAGTLASSGFRWGQGWGEGGGGGGGCCGGSGRGCITEELPAGAAAYSCLPHRHWRSVSLPVLACW